ncbi:MAG: fibrobacter succinogenes major paralogous domain-containing protein [Saprospiraceae bacterium]
MRKRTNFLSYPLLIMGLFLVFASSCEKDDDNPASDNQTNGKTTAVFNPAVTYGTMTDQNGNVYKTVTIGTQIWMAENLRTTKYNDGTSIPNITSYSVWDNLTTGAYCNYDNTSSNDTIATFGRLYNWNAVNTGKLAPTGWHVPSDAEWTQLSTYLGGESVAGDKLKETGTTHWNSPNTNATNKTGFTALPGGGRSSGGAFSGIGYAGYWWSSTAVSPGSAYCRAMDVSGSIVYRSYLGKNLGFSVRCVRD